MTTSPLSSIRGRSLPAFMMLSLLLLAGCDPAQRLDLQDAKGEILVNDNTNTERILQGQINILKNDLGKQEILLANVVSNNEKLKEQLEIQRKAIEDQQFDSEDIRKILTVAFGVGGQVAGGNIGGAIDTFVNAIVNASEEAAENKAKADFELMDVKINQFEDDTETTLLSMNRKAESLESKVAALSSDLQAKLKKVQNASEADKAALADQIKQAGQDPAEVNRLIAEYLATQGLTTAEIQQLQETFGTTELLTLLGIGGAYGYRRFGRSAYKDSDTDHPKNSGTASKLPSQQTVNITVADDKMTIDKKQ